MFSRLAHSAQYALALVSRATDGDFLSIQEMMSPLLTVAQVTRCCKNGSRKEREDVPSQYTWGGPRVSVRLGKLGKLDLKKCEKLCICSTQK